VHRDQLEGVAAAGGLSRGRGNQARNLLNAFVNQLEALRGKDISSENVDTLLRLMSGLPG